MITSPGCRTRAHLSATALLCLGLGLSAAPGAAQSGGEQLTGRTSAQAEIGVDAQAAAGAEAQAAAGPEGGLESRLQRSAANGGRADSASAGEARYATGAEAYPEDGSAREVERGEPDRDSGEPHLLDIGSSFGSGVMRGGHGDLAAAQRAPIFLDVTVLTPHEPWLLLGGSLRVELEDGRAVAAIFRATLRYKLTRLELRPGASIPFYFAPKTMLGPEANLGLRYPVNLDFGFTAGIAVSAFMVGNDVPKGTTVVMFHGQIGVDLLL